jgi:hypothetical protein
MPKRVTIISDVELNDGADSVLKVTLYQIRTLRNGKTIYVYYKNLEDINTPFGEIDDRYLSQSDQIRLCDENCRRKVNKIKNADNSKIMLEESVGEQLTPEQLEELATHLDTSDTSIIVSEESDSLDDLLNRLGSVTLGGGRKIKRRRMRTNKRRRNKKRRTNKRR